MEDLSAVAAMILDRNDEPHQKQLKLKGLQPKSGSIRPSVTCRRSSSWNAGSASSIRKNWSHETHSLEGEKQRDARFGQGAELTSREANTYTAHG